MQLPLLASGVVMLVLALVFGLERRLRGRLMSGAVYGLCGAVLVGMGATGRFLRPGVVINWWIFVVVAAFAVLRVAQLILRKRAAPRRD